MPPRAASNPPTCCAIALVKLPFSCPNKWDAAMSFGIAPRLTGTNVPRRRGLRSRMSRAPMSLPAPLSPATRTQTRVAATRDTFSGKS